MYPAAGGCKARKSSAIAPHADSDLIKYQHNSVSGEPNRLSPAADFQLALPAGGRLHRSNSRPSPPRHWGRQPECPWYNPSRWGRGGGRLTGEGQNLLP